MPGTLLVGIRQTDHRTLSVRSAQKADADGKPVLGEPRRDRDGRNEDQEGVEVGCPLRTHIGRIDPVPDEGRLMLHRLVDNGIELMLGHGLQHQGHELLTGQ